MNNVYKAFVALVAAGIKEEKTDEKVLSELTSEDFSRVLNLAKFHGVLPVLCRSLGTVETDLIGDEVRQKINDIELAAVAKSERLAEEEKILYDLLEQNGIEFIVLKGLAIRSLYLKKETRSSCDVDVLLKPQDKEAAIRLLTNGGYSRVKDYKEEITFLSEQNQAVELHFDITEGDKKLKDLFSGVFERANTFENKKFQKGLCAEDFVAYHVAHVAKHLLGGGSGIKSVCDTFVIEERLKYDKEKVEEALSESGLNKLWKELVALKDYMFHKTVPSPLTERFAEYVISGGAYGSEERGNQIKKSRQGKVKYAFSRLFLPCDELKAVYPILVKHKALYPFCSVHRFFKFVFKKKGSSKTKGDFGGAEAQKLLEELGL